MIISSGIYRGIPLISPKGSDTRPTLAKTRQAIFNMIRPYLAGETIIDFFSGTGAFGFEALSNGASKSYFVDLAQGDIIEKNAAKLKVARNAYSFIKGDFSDGAAALKRMKIKSGVIFADPPYNKGYVKMVLQSVAHNDILKNDGLVVMELHYKEKESLDNNLSGWTVIKEKKYGETYVWCLQKAEV
jgi:16S rRNA (guanine(966)-N(2))-methyltransferase RsmD